MNCANIEVSGSAIRTLRLALGIDVQTFAQLFGVSLSTAYRWEGLGNDVVRLDPHQRRMVLLLQQHIDQKRKQSSDLGKTIAGAVVAGGAMFALYKVLEAIFGGKK